MAHSFHSIRTWPARLLARPWLLGFVPINAATSGFGVALPLLILITLHSSWASVALAATLFNTAVILSSFFWGWVSDRFPARRALLVVNYAGFGALYLVLTHIPSLPLLLTVYTLVGVLAPAGTSASNLLILEKFTEKERANAYASFQEMSILGSMAGLLIGYFWVVRDDALQSLLFVLAGLAAVSAAVIWFGVKDPEQNLKIANVAQHPESLGSRIRFSSAFHLSIPFFPKRPKVTSDAYARFRKWVRTEIHHELPLIFGAMFLFNLSSNLFNISYTPYLYALGLGAASIFLVNFSNNTAQGIMFPISGNLTARWGADRLVQRSTYVRSIGYLIVGAFTFVTFFGGGAFAANLIVFGVLGGAIALYSTASSMILFRAVQHRDAGSLLGINSALGGAAAVGGALASELISIFGSFRLVFLVSAGALLVSLPLWTAASVAHRRRHEEAIIVEPKAAPREAKSAATGQTD
jgi:MFS family permease